MKFVLTLALLLTVSAHADSYFTGSSDLAVEHDFDQSHGDYFAGASEFVDKVRDIAYDDKKKEKLPMKDDAYFTGSSL